MKRLRILTLLLVVLAFLIHTYRESISVSATISYNNEIPDEWFITKGEILTPIADRRLADQTYLTFPEWFLVFSPEEQAEFLKDNTSTNYPYRSQVNQFWDSYGILARHIDGKYPYNEEYNTMINVIGVSTDIEYSLRSWYETVIGRVTQTSSITQEDQFNQQYISEYAAFLNSAAWYDFDYKQQLKNLWTENSFFGWNMLRKFERKYLLSSEFLIKIAYAELIKFGSQSMYGEIPNTTVIVTDRLTKAMENDESIKIISSNEVGHVLRIPRYTEFMYTASLIANEGVNIIEVAGNKSAILITVICDRDDVFNEENTRLLFAQKMLNNEHQFRLAICTPIENLTEFIRFCQSNRIEVEHIYDF